MNSKLLMLAGTTLALVLAGCATPDETTDGTPFGDNNDTGDDGVFDTQGQRVVIDQWVYECDDTFDADGVCDGYDLADDQNQTGDETQATVNDDGTVTIDGRTYTCADTNTTEVGDPAGSAGACERYELEAEQ